MGGSLTVRYLIMNKKNSSLCNSVVRIMQNQKFLASKFLDYACPACGETLTLSLEKNGFLCPECSKFTDGAFDIISLYQLKKDVITSKAIEELTKILEEK